ncbi:hypothetical protein PVA45_06070 [Entomospira entomophila]|uniref:Uncharacterized protein n=1 Tax=Entomospira entomophila TaxID=2719988 RepID=A0A968GB03_9SPIO|nr:hypothetical protein [Entomospira entomophilus]NIZ41065.1 hypothetical protein [Entomospira entomophilus]WDI35274.1 hypothetical protein PVA45_06070 [Entomospira entomophilus]
MNKLKLTISIITVILVVSGFYLARFPFLWQSDAPDTGPYPIKYKDDGTQFLKIRTLNGSMAFNSYRKYLVLHDKKTNLPIDYIRYGEFLFEAIYFDDEKIIIKVLIVDGWRDKSYIEGWTIGNEDGKSKKNRLGKYLIEYIFFSTHKEYNSVSEINDLS